MFWKKKNETNNTGTKALNSVEYDFCLKRIAEINSRVEALAVKFEILQTDCNNLRGKFNQRLKSFGTEDIKQDSEKPKEINTSEPVYI